MFREDREAGRRELLRILRRYNGSPKRAAVDLGIDRTHLFRIIWRENLWPEIDKMRAEAKLRGKVVDPDARWIAAASELLRKSA